MERTRVMRLAQLIKDSKAAVVERWYELVLSSYPQETVTLWKKQRSEFANPVGATFLGALDELLEAVLAWQDAGAVSAALERIVKIRAVQDMPPSRALSFIPGFKKLLREQFAESIASEGLVQELAMFDARMDNATLIGFDIYTKSREQLFEMRINEFKSAHHMAFRKAGIICESPRQALGLNTKQGK